MNTVQDVFDIAIHLLDEQNESTGATRTTDTKTYELRTPNILNNLLDRCYRVSDTCVMEPGKRPICRKVHAMEDEIDLDEFLCTGVLPYGLAAMLILPEGLNEMSDFFWQTFEEQLYSAGATMPATEEAIEDVYGTDNPHGQYSHW